MNDSSQTTDECYSVINTKLRRREFHSEACIEKCIVPNVNLGVSLDKLKRLVDQYILQLKTAGIPLPPVRSARISEDGLLYVCRYAGKNIVECFGADELFTIGGHGMLEQITAVLANAITHNLCLDPHPKNFTWDGSTVNYVDFSPPYLPEYVNLRLQVALENECAIIQENFRYFSPPYLIAHFVGDFFNVYPNVADGFIAKSYDWFFKKELITSSYEEFRDLAKRIRFLEDSRIERNIFLF